MRSEIRGPARLLWLLCQTLALSACGPESMLEGEPELGTLEQKTYGSDLGRAIGASIASTNTCGLVSDFTPGCSYSSNAPDIAYIWTAPWTSNYTFTTQGSNFDTILEVRPYNDTTQSLGCNDDSSGTLQSSVTTQLSAGQTVLLIVDGYASACGGSRLNITSDMHMLFGGMWGQRAGGSYVNPYTGSNSCPAGYTPHLVLWSPNVDHPLYFCGRFADETTEPISDFGGMFGWSATGTYPNPITGAMSCPPGYLNQPVYGSPNLDHTIHFCHRQHVTGNTGRYRFGGMFGTTQGGVYPNPITGTTSCPNGFTSKHTFGTPYLDYDLTFCYRDMGP